MKYKKGLIGILAKLFCLLGDGIAMLFGYKLVVTLGEHEIKLDYVKPKEIKGIKAWDNSHYKNGNVFLEGFANPVKAFIDRKKKGLKLISSERYIDYMQNTLIRDVIRVAEGKMLTLEKMFKITLVAVLVNMILTLFFVMAVLGVFG